MLKYEIELYDLLGKLSLRSKKLSRAEIIKTVFSNYKEGPDLRKKQLSEKVPVLRELDRRFLERGFNRGK